MKKVITLVGASLFFASSVIAEGLIGIKLGMGDLEASKAGYTAGSTSYAGETKSEDHEYGAIFGEISVPQVDGLSLGLEYIPFTATLTVDGNSSDSSLELSDHTTIYALYGYDVGNVSAYGKAGIAMADISKVVANYDTTTINSHDNSLDGIMLGVGLQTDISEFVGRLELTYTEYDSVGVTTTSNGSASVKKSADAELMTVSISIAKAF